MQVLPALKAGNDGNWMTTAAEAGNVTVHTSMTMHSVSCLCMEERTLQMIAEIDFKYQTGEVLPVVPTILDGFNPAATDQTDSRDVSPSELAFPFVFTNAVELTIHRELHFFKKTAAGSDGSDDSVNPPSMYGSEGVEAGHRSLSDLLCDKDKTAIFWKCEKYFVTVKLSAWINDSDIPFANLGMFVKLGTNGAPGTESLHLSWDTADSICRFPTAIGHFDAVEIAENLDGSGVKLGKYYVNEVKMELATSYPRLYICAMYKSDWVMPVFKYYLVPMALTVCVTLGTYEVVDFVSFAATLILSDIALLFTLTTSTSITREERALCLNLVLLVMYTIMTLVSDDADWGLSGWLKTIIQVFMVLVNIVLFVFDKISAQRLCDRYLSAVKTSNFEILGEI